MKLLQGDCLELMKDIPSKSIDMILCDLPYQVTRNQWDTIIPFQPLWEQYERIIKENGAIVLFGKGRFTAKLIISNEKLYKYTLIWEKTRPSGFLNAKKMPMQSHEDVIIFYKKPPTYNPQMQKGEPYFKKHTANENTSNYGEYVSEGRTSENNGTRYPKSVIKFSNDNHNSLHPTQKPVKLLEYLIKTYSNENDTILDNCMGSGSTGIACLNTNRKFIGMELDQNYFEIASKRIEEHKRGLGHEKD